MKTRLSNEPPAGANAIAPGRASAADRVERWSFVWTTAVALTVYLFTLAPNVTLEFSGILSAGAMYGGVPHPPGYPLWTVCGWLCIKLIPLANPAWRLAAGSAVAAALACGFVALLVARAGKVAFAATSRFSHLDPTERDLLRGGSGGVAGLVLAFSGGVWAKAVIADIWALSFLLFTAGLWLLMRWTFDPCRRGWLCGTFFLFGLLLTNSQEWLVALPGFAVAILLADENVGRDVSLILLPVAALATAFSGYGVGIVFPATLNWPVLAAFLAAFLTGLGLALKSRQALGEWKIAVGCGLGFLLGLACYFYVPVAAMTNPPVNWGYPRTTEGFLHVLHRGQYESVSPTADAGTYARQVWWFVQATGREFGWLPLGLAWLAFGFIRSWNRPGRNWLFGLLAIFAGVGPLLLAILNPPPVGQSLELLKPHFVATHIVLAVWLGLGLMLAGAAFRPGQAGPGTSL